MAESSDNSVLQNKDLVLLPHLLRGRLHRGLHHQRLLHRGLHHHHLLLHLLVVVVQEGAAAATMTTNL